MTLLFTNGVVILPRPACVSHDGRRRGANASSIGSARIERSPTAIWSICTARISRPGSSTSTFTAAAVTTSWTARKKPSFPSAKTHARHGTTSLLPTTTVAKHEQHLAVLGLCKKYSMKTPAGPAASARISTGRISRRRRAGCHPPAPLRPPLPAEYRQYVEFASVICGRLVAPELPGAEEFARACRVARHPRQSRPFALHVRRSRRGPRMGRRSRRSSFLRHVRPGEIAAIATYPMRGGPHGSDPLLRRSDHRSPRRRQASRRGAFMKLAYKVKGPDRLALVTDASRAVDCPDGRVRVWPARRRRAVSKEKRRLDCSPTAFRSPPASSAWTSACEPSIGSPASPSLR